MKEISINSKKHGLHKILVDDEDYNIVSGYRWYLGYGGKTFYAIKEHTKTIDGGRKKIALHKFILDLDDDMEIDHIDHNGLNCQKSNLRVCTHKNNCRNRSRAKNSASNYLGVFIKNCNIKNTTYTYWVAAIKESGNSKCTKTKSFPFTKDGEIAAAKYYDTIAKQHYGEFANLNFK